MGKHKHSLKSKKHKGSKLTGGEPAAAPAAPAAAPAGAEKPAKTSTTGPGAKATAAAPTKGNRIITGFKNVGTKLGNVFRRKNKDNKGATSKSSQQGSKRRGLFGPKQKGEELSKSNKKAKLAAQEQPSAAKKGPAAVAQGSPGQAPANSGSTAAPGPNITTSDKTFDISPAIPGGQGTFMDVFKTVYIVLAGIGLVVLAGLFIFTTVDIIRFSTKWVGQTFAAYFLSKDIFNKDTIEMQLLEYHKNDSKDEPYTIFLQQYIAQFMFLYGAFTAVLIVINVCVYGLMMLYFRLRTIVNHGESLNLVENFKYFIIIGLTVLVAGLIHVTYKYWFQKSLQKKLINSYSTVTDITDKIYINMTTNTDFITNLVNSSEQQDAIQANIDIMNKVDGADKIDIIARMIFTSSVYNYFKNIIPGKDEENYNNVIKPMFLQKASSLLLPTDYMYYQQNMFIPNDYNNIIDHIFGEDKVIKNKADDIALVKKLNDIFTQVNSTSKHIYRLPKNVPSMFWYFIVNFIIMVVVIMIIITIYGTDFKKIFNEFILGPCNKLSQMILSKDICSAFTNIPEEPKKSEDCKPTAPEPAGTIKTTITPGPSQTSSSPSATSKPAASSTTAPKSEPPKKEEEKGKAVTSDTAKGKDLGSTKQLGKTDAAAAKETEEAKAVADTQGKDAVKAEAADTGTAAKAAVSDTAEQETGKKQAADTGTAEVIEPAVQEQTTSPAEQQPKATGQNEFIATNTQNAAATRRKKTQNGAVEQNPVGGRKRTKDPKENINKILK